MSQHTPGEWAVATFVLTGRECGVYQVLEDGSDGDYVCRFDGDDHDDTELKANARLIAASPTLLEACQAAEKWFSIFVGDEGGPYSNVFELRDKLRAAVSLALGETK